MKPKQEVVLANSDFLSTYYCAARIHPANQIFIECFPHARPGGYVTLSSQAFKSFRGNRHVTEGE